MLGYTYPCDSHLRPGSSSSYISWLADASLLVWGRGYFLHQTQHTRHELLQWRGLVRWEAGGEAGKHPVCWELDSQHGIHEPRFCCSAAGP